MKKIFNRSFFLIILISFGCKKNPDDKKIEITSNNLTSCPADLNCTYLYKDGADFGEPFFLNLKKGDFKIFKYSALLGNGYYAKHVYIRVPLNVTQFELGNDQVLAGEVKYANPCASCDVIGLKVVGGSFKGIKSVNANQTSRWLLEGKVYLSTIQPSSYQDSIIIKQYFNLDPAGI
ncbi:hypothetical protein GJU39_11295 [Pedobacter petrophilus]|uniref:Lipoprotein n=1 Tax=Pedobacter petrophilus TaxID=1908241 RepID=A0A7K0FZ74_9SPHI|nr:hypothetical protein [Pedobacter petrophilus]MRX76672.1 hypothetical protein [Pedobacter petrophilus]